MLRSVFIRVKVIVKQIGEKYHFHHHKEYEQLNEYYGPKGFPESHVPETFIIKPPYFIKKTGRGFP